MSAAAHDLTRERELEAYKAGFRDGLDGHPSRSNCFVHWTAYLNGRAAAANLAGEVVLFDGKVFGTSSRGAAYLANCEIPDGALFGTVDYGGRSIRWCELELFCEAGGWPE